MTKRKPKNSKTDVIKLLTADHKKVKKLFKGFEEIKENNLCPAAVLTRD